MIKRLLAITAIIGFLSPAVIAQGFNDDIYKKTDSSKTNTKKESSKNNAMTDDDVWARDKRILDGMEKAAKNEASKALVTGKKLDGVRYFLEKKEMQTKMPGGKVNKYDSACSHMRNDKAVAYDYCNEELVNRIIQTQDASFIVFMYNNDFGKTIVNKDNVDALHVLAMLSGKFDSYVNAQLAAILGNYQLADSGIKFNDLLKKQIKEKSAVEGWNVLHLAAHFAPNKEGKTLNDVAAIKSYQATYLRSAFTGKDKEYCELFKQKNKQGDIPLQTAIKNNSKVGFYLLVANAMGADGKNKCSNAENAQDFDKLIKGDGKKTEGTLFTVAQERQKNGDSFWWDALAMLGVNGISSPVATEHLKNFQARLKDLGSIGGSFGLGGAEALDDGKPSVDLKNGNMDTIQGTGELKDLAKSEIINGKEVTTFRVDGGVYAKPTKEQFAIANAALPDFITDEKGNQIPNPVMQNARSARNLWMYAKENFPADDPRVAMAEQAYKSLLNNATHPEISYSAISPGQDTFEAFDKKVEKFSNDVQEGLGYYDAKTGKEIKDKPGVDINTAVAKCAMFQSQIQAKIKEYRAAKDKEAKAKIAAEITTLDKRRASIGVNLMASTGAQFSKDIGACADSMPAIDRLNADEEQSASSKNWNKVKGFFGAGDPDVKGNPEKEDIIVKGPYGEDIPLKKGATQEQIDAAKYGYGNEDYTKDTHYQNAKAALLERCRVAKNAWNNPRATKAQKEMATQHLHLSAQDLGGLQVPEAEVAAACYIEKVGYGTVANKELVQGKLQECMTHMNAAFNYSKPEAERKAAEKEVNAIVNGLMKSGLTYNEIAASGCKPFNDGNAEGMDKLNKDQQMSRLSNECEYITNNARKNKNISNKDYVTLEYNKKTLKELGVSAVIVDKKCSLADTGIKMEKLDTPVLGVSSQPAAPQQQAAAGANSNAASNKNLLVGPAATKRTEQLRKEADTALKANDTALAQKLSQEADEIEAQSLGITVDNLQKSRLQSNILQSNNKMKAELAKTTDADRRETLQKQIKNNNAMLESLGVDKAIILAPTAQNYDLSTSLNTATLQPPAQSPLTGAKTNPYGLKTSVGSTQPDSTSTAQAVDLRKKPATVGGAPYREPNMFEGGYANNNTGADSTAVKPAGAPAVVTPNVEKPEVFLGQQASRDSLNQRQIAAKTEIKNDSTINANEALIQKTFNTGRTTATAADASTNSAKLTAEEIKAKQDRCTDIAQMIYDRKGNKKELEAERTKIIDELKSSGASAIACFTHG